MVLGPNSGFPIHFRVQQEPLLEAGFQFRRPNTFPHWIVSNFCYFVPLFRAQLFFCTALLGHETKTTSPIWNYCLGSTAAAFLLLGIFFGLILFLGDFRMSPGWPWAGQKLLVPGNCAATSAKLCAPQRGSGGISQRPKGSTGDGPPVMCLMCLGLLWRLVKGGVLLKAMDG